MLKSFAELWQMLRAGLGTAGTNGKRR
jgi:hypothetical protein